MVGWCRRRLPGKEGTDGGTAGDTPHRVRPRGAVHADRVHQATREGIEAGVKDLWELTQRVDAQLGPYPTSMVELGAGVRAHMGVLGPA